jgi:hypothetical protein
VQTSELRQCWRNDPWSENQLVGSLPTVSSARVALYFAIFFLTLSRQSLAANDDGAYLACHQNFGNAVDKWRKSPLPPNIRHVVRDILTLSTGTYVAQHPLRPSVVRWVSHMNGNGTNTVVVELTSPHTDFDDWIIFLQDGKAVAEKHYVHATGFAFSRNSSGGVNGLYFCGKGEPSHE